MIWQGQIEAGSDVVKSSNPSINMMSCLNQLLLDGGFSRGLCFHAAPVFPVRKKINATFCDPSHFASLQNTTTSN